MDHGKDASDHQHVCGALGKTLDRDDETQLILEKANEAYISIDEQSRIINWNPYASQVFGWTKEEALGQPLHELIIPQQYREAHKKGMAKFLATGEGPVLYKTIEIIAFHRTKGEFPVELNIFPIKINQIYTFHAFIRDITDRKQAEKEIRYLSNHDMLTNLYNRAEFERRLKSEIVNSRQDNTSVAVLMLDLDNFKTVNDTFGHHVGDQLLVIVAKQLQESVRKEDFVARLGGDEFVVIFPNIRDETDVKKLAQKLIKRFNKPFKLENHYFHATMSIGIAVSPHSGKDELTLVKNADIALYSVKESGRNNYQFFSDEINETFKYRSKLETELPAAIQRNQFFIVYQPQYKLPEKKIIGMEALLRWQHPEFGLISPNDFIPIAEKNGFIVLIGEWVLKNACQQYVNWKSQCIIPDNLKLAVNLSPKQLAKEQFTESFLAILKETNMPPQNLELELTETAVMTSAIDLDPILEELQNIGIRISIDDFGAGYSSLSRLKNLPVSSLKIDKSFINDLENDPDDAMIVKSIIALGNSLGLNVIPEGVETENQLKLLMDYHCQIVQGFYFGKEPLKADAMTSLLKKDFQKLAE